VLEGELTFTTGDRELRAEEGSWVQLPPDVPHTFAFAGDRRVRFLDIHTPSCGLGTFDQEPA
jgi:quercetin dioxygenase-like cupin family protein